MKSIRIFIVCLTFVFTFSAIGADAARCKSDLADNRGIWKIDLNHQFPRTQSQGQNGTCYMYSLMSAVSAALYRKSTNDHRLRATSGARYVKDFEYSPEITLMLMAIADNDFLNDRLAHAERRKREKKQFLGLFDSGDSGYILKFLKKNPEALVPVDLWTKVSWFSNASTFIYDEFNKANELNGNFGPSAARARIVKAMLRIIAAFEKTPEMAGVVRKLRQNGFTWDHSRKELQLTRNSSQDLPLTVVEYFPNNNDYDACQRMIDAIFSGVCQGIPAIVSTTIQYPSEDFERYHASVVVGTIPIGTKGVLQATDLMIRDSARLTSQADQFNPHTGLVGFPLRKACQTVLKRFRLYQAQFILAPGESI